MGVSPVRSTVPWSAQAEHNQDDSGDGENEPNGKPHSAPRHETSRDQVHALPGKYSPNDQSDHSDEDQGDAPGSTSHVPQLTLDWLRAPIRQRSDTVATTQWSVRELGRGPQSPPST